MSNHPTHCLFFAQTYKRNGEEKTQWIDCGAAWQQKDGESFTLSVQTLPIGFFAEGRLVLRKISEGGDTEA